MDNNYLLEINNLKKSYNTKKGEILAIKNISISIKDNEIIGIVGPSGCGKSTLLSIIANLDVKSSGNIDKRNNLTMSYMMQNDALLPYYSVYDNSVLGLKIKKIKDNKYYDYVNELLKFYNLDEFKDKYPSSLSGGMRQRVV